jgi:hypothetical protein
MPQLIEPETAMTDGPADKDCPVCGAIGPDYCQLVKCEWNMTEPPGFLEGWPQ